jgi:drug/metabolite transporter (DMT)-like permease
MTTEQTSLISGLVYSIISASCFGFLPVFFKLGYAANLDTGTMLSFRFVFALIILFPFILITKRKHLKIGIKALFMAFICGSFFYGLQSYFFAASLQYLSASTTSLILYIYPLTVLILSSIFFKSKITGAKILAIVLIFAGCLCVFYDAFHRQMDPKGLVLATLAMVAFSAYLIFIQKSLVIVDSTVFSFYVFAFTALQCLVVYRPFSDLSLNIEQWTVCLLLSVIPTVFAIIFLYKAIERIGSSYASIFSSVEPAVTIIASAILLKDPIKALQVLGMVFIIAGIVVPNLRLITRR